MSNYKRKILLTGSSGFIGSHLKASYQGQYQLYCHDLDTFNFLDEDKTSDYLKRMKFDVIIHTATWSDSRNLNNNPADVLAKNLNMFFNLARNRDTFGKLIYYGSGAEYDRQNMPPKVKEEHFGANIPGGAYGLSKYVMAKQAIDSNNIFELVPFAVFGPGEDWRIRFISNACCRDIFDLPILVKKNVVYDYLYINDLVKVTDWFVNNTPPEHRYNVCSGRPYDLFSLAQMVQKHSGKNNKIIVKDPSMGLQYSGDNSRLLKAITGMKFCEMEFAIAAVYQWYLERKNQINKAELSFDDN